MTPADIPTHEALALQIKHLGVPCVFGLMSDDTALLVASIDAVGVAFHGARHENNAVAMAEGYASSSGRLGIVLLGRGPATANGLHGIAYAHKTGSRVLLLLGAGSDAPADPNGFGPDTKALDQVALLRASAVRVMTATDPASAPQMLVRAAAAARQGLMALLLPMNMLNGTTPLHAIAQAAPPAQSMPAAAPRAAAIDAAIAALHRARKPLILAGHGVHLAGAREAVIRLADHLGAALATTMKAKDLFRGHPFDCGVVGPEAA